MVAMRYVGLGSAEAAVRAFEALAPYVGELVALQRECVALGADHAAFGIALDGLETAAYHFTRRRYFYHAVREFSDDQREGNGRLQDPTEAIGAFKALRPYYAALGFMQRKRHRLAELHNIRR